jgi:hypothetical protein
VDILLKIWNNPTVQYVEDPNAYIFNVKSNTMIKVTDLPNSIKVDPKGGITFGSGYDIFVNLDTKTGQINPLSYLGPDNIGVLGKGRRTFIITDIEVWQVKTEAVSCLGQWVDIPNGCDNMTGLMNQYYNITREPAFGGKECEAKQNDQRIAKTDTCKILKIDCQGNWLDSPNGCNIITGLMNQYYNVIIKEDNGGKKCEAIHNQKSILKHQIVVQKY